MQTKPFSQPIAIRTDGGNTEIVSTAAALDFLTGHWPVARGPRAEDAVETCLKVLEGYRSTVDAETTFREAAREAGILADAAEPGLQE